MVCNSCGAMVQEDEAFCPVCHALLKESPVRGEDPLLAYRQGKRGQMPLAAPEMPVRRRRRSGESMAGAPEASAAAAADKPYTLPSWELPEPREEGDLPGAEGEEYIPPDTVQDDPPVSPRGVTARYGYTQMNDAIPVPRRSKAGIQRITNRPMVNWTKLLLAGIAGLILVIGGIVFFLRSVPAGQRIFARLGGEVPALALWEVGEEKLDTGDIDGAIHDFEKARELDGELGVNVDGLLLLGGAYEAAGRVDDAEQLYRDIYTTVTPTRPEAYRHVIRLLIASDRKAEAAELMQKAYESTGQAAFRQQREEFIPKPPEASPIAGFYEQVKKLTLISTEGYDVYYTADANARLPEEGTRYTEPIILDEGNHDLRAVVVNGELVSDLWKGNYRIIKPSPQTPQSNLAPNTYKQRQRVRLRPGKDNEKDTDITIYYTIDGSIPDANSPIYTGEPIVLPGGRVTLKAVAVNGDNKASNMLEVGYKIEAKPFPLTHYSNQDRFEPFSLYTTTREDFFAKFGEGQEGEEVVLDRYETPCKQYVYTWGYALMYKTQKSWVLVQVSLSNQEFQAPRNTQVGMTMDEVISKFRDMGQLPGSKGHRGLYALEDNTGKVIPQADVTKIVEYITDSNNGFNLMLEYICDANERVREIRYTAVPY